MHYPKIAHLNLSLAVQPEVMFFLEEKIDGSQFRAWLNEDGELVCGSKAVDYLREQPVDQMFRPAFDRVEAVKDSFKPGHFYFFEFVGKPKQNTLCYERVPRNNLVLFDVFCEHESVGGRWFNESELTATANEMLFEPVNCFGSFAWKDLTFELVKELFEKESCLGRETIEGVVLKARSEFQLNPYSRHYEPLLFKFVQEKFKERNDVEWKAKKVNVVEALIETYRTEGRWLKAVQHLKEQGLLEKQPRDIPKVLTEVERDLLEEETEAVKEKLFQHFKSDLTRGWLRGIPIWYKELLAKGELK